jgi:tetratricopeptide (TPR) repeat protein
MVEKFPDIAQHWVNHGQYMERMDRYEEAARSFDRAFALDPDNEQIRSRYEHTRSQVDGLQKGLKNFREMVECEPDNAYGWYKYAEFLSALRHDQEAAQMRERVLALDPLFYERFNDLPLDEDTRILQRQIRQLKESKILFCYEYWSWDGILGGSVIFQRADLIGFSEEEAQCMARQAIGLPEGTRFSGGLGKLEDPREETNSKYVFFNYADPME